MKAHLKTKFWTLILTFLSLLIFGSSCSYADFNSRYFTLEDVLTITNHRRESIPEVSEERLLELIYGRTPSFHPTVMHHSRQRIMQELTAAFAIGDVMSLFHRMRATYAAYTYFGGDEVFIPLREEINQQIRDIGNDITPEILSEIIRRNLVTIIADNHFVFDMRYLYTEGSPVPFAAATFFHNPNLIFDKSNGGFSNRENGLYVKEIVGYDMHEILRLSIDDDGYFFFSPIVYSWDFSIENYKLTVIYEDNTIEVIALEQAERIKQDWEEASATFHEGIPVINMRSMFLDPVNRDFENASRFIGFAEEFRDEPVLIVDIRGNGGGDSTLVNHWLHVLTGQIVPTNFVALATFAYVPSQVGEYEFGDPDTLFYIPDMYIYHPASSFNGFWLIQNLGREIIQRDQILILLTDRFVGSAAEIFVKIAFNIENTLIIGQNTAGVAIAGGGSPPFPFLPSSGIEYSFGDRVVVYPEGLFEEGVGFAPDIWVHGDALAATIAMLRNAGFGADY